MVFNRLFKNILKKKEILNNPIITSFKDIENCIYKKKQEIKNKEKDVLKNIKEKKEVFIKEINIKAKDIENIDIDSKDVDKRIKKIVKKNIKEYLDRLNNLIDKINNLDEENFEIFIKSINNYFIDFEKKSIINYERASFLLKNDLFELRKDLVDFSEYLVKILEKEKNIIKTSRIIYLVQESLEEIKEANKTIEETNIEIKHIEEKRKDLESNKQELLEKIKNIKENKKHIENIKKIEALKINENKITKNIFELKEIIDFKALANIYHVDKRKMLVIKEYKENFKENFTKNNNDYFFTLLEDAKLNNTKITSKIEEINKLKEKINVYKKTITKDETKELFNEINNIKTEIEATNFEKENKLKKLDKIKQNKAEFFTLLKKDLSKINIEISNDCYLQTRWDSNPRSQA